MSFSPPNTKELLFNTPSYLGEECSKMNANIKQINEYLHLNVIHMILHEDTRPFLNK